MLPCKCNDQSQQNVKGDSYIFKEEIVVGQPQNSHQLLAKSKHKIAFFAGDVDNFHFIQPIIDRLKTSEFETRIVKSNGLSQDNLFNHMQWSDVSWFEWANGPIIHATKLPKVCRIVCRLHKYEAYSDSPKQIDWNKVDNFILVSSVMLDVFKELQIGDIEKRTKVHIIPNAIDLSPYKFKLKKKGFNIAYISRFHPDKNPALMIQILSEVVKIDPRYRCFMVGTIQNLPLYQYIKHMIKQLGLQENLIYEGITTDVNSWLDDKHYILSTSIIESQGMCIVEGMAKGLKPVIHNFVGDPCAIFDRKYVFNTSKQAVEMILSDEYFPAEYRKHIELKYNLNDVFNKYKSILFENRKKITFRPLEIKEPPITQPIPTYNRVNHLNDTQRNGSYKKCFGHAQYPPILSICIPTYNRAEFLVDTIHSALDQKYEHFELLVIDDGSTDNTSELISSIKDPRLRYIKKFHTGAPDTRNRAINEASGNFIIWLGSDDILMPNTVTKYVNAIYQYPEVDVFYGDLIIMDRVENFIRELKYPNFYNQNAILLNRFLFGCALPDGGSLIRKQLYQNFGGYNLDFKRAHDYEFWARIADKIIVNHIGSFVYKWRWHDSNMSSGSVNFDSSYDIMIKKNILKSHSLKELFPYLNWNEEKNSLETAYYAIGNSFNQLKGFKEAIKYYEKCLEINNSENYYCAMGLTYFQLEDLKKSLWAFNEALIINPENEKAKEIYENLNKILCAKNQKHQINLVAVVKDEDCQRRSDKNIGPLVSVIVPTFNRPQMLTESVKSILSQSYQNFEILVVNDAGVDISEILNNVSDKRIRYLQHTENKGRSAAKNTGIKSSKGKYIAYLDDDDIYYQDHLETLVNELEKGAFKVAYTDSIEVVQQKSESGFDNVKQRLVYSQDFDRELLLKTNYIPILNVMHHRDCPEEIGFFDEDLSVLEDWDFWIRMSKRTDFVHIQKITAEYHIRTDLSNATTAESQSFPACRRRIWQKHLSPNHSHNSIRIAPLTSIIILTCNQIEYTKKCVESIFQNTQQLYELIIVDNGSTDGTVEYLESEVQYRNKAIVVKVIKNMENKGFAAGNNQGIAAANGDYIILMNNDVVVTPGWLGRMISCAAKMPEIGIVGPRSNYVSGPQLVERVDYDTHTLNGLIEFSNKFADDYTGQAQQILRVVGFCMLIKRAVIDRIGGMDDRFGLGNFEDDDFSLRATIAGFQSWIARDCFMHHFGHRTFVGQKIDLSKSLLKNWDLFKEKWGLPAAKPYGFPYRLSEMKNTQFDPSIHYYPLDNESACTKKSGNDSKTLEIQPGNEAARQHLEGLKRTPSPATSVDAQSPDEINQALDRQPTESGLSPSESAKTFSVLTDKIGFNSLGLRRSAAESRAATASIIVSLDGIQNYVKECIRSVVLNTPETHEILLINRGATKAILKWVQQLVKDNGSFRIIEGTKQAGWAESLNQAIQEASGDMIVLMHNDVAVPEGWLKAFKMLKNLVSNIGVMGPMANRAKGVQQMIHFDDFDRVEFKSAVQAFYEQNQYRRVVTRKLSDFFLAFPRELTDKIGYFDEQFVSEEVVIEDFCHRAAAGGYQNVIAADICVYHYDRHKAKKNSSSKNSACAEDQMKYKEKWIGAHNPNAKALQTVQLLARADEMRQGGQINAAVEILLGAIGVQTENPTFYLGLSEILLAAKRYQDAKETLSEMPPAGEDREMRKAELMAYAEEGLENYEAAQVQIERVLLTDSGCAPALNLKGILAYRNDDCPSAEKYFKRAIHGDPGYGEPYNNLGMLSLEADRPQEALNFFEKAFRLAPTDLDIATNYHTLIAGTAEYEKAESVAREAVTLYPKNQKIKYMLIDFLIQQGKYEIAMAEIEDAIIKFGTDDGILGAALKVRERLGPITIQKSSQKASVSLCMIIKDEEKYLARCLANVKPIIDEMILVDTGSTDRSKDIGITFGAKVYDYEWENDFAEARNYSISKASGEWILILDGDEVISPLDHTNFSKILKKTPRGPIAYSIITRNYNKLANIVGWVPNDGTYPEEEAAIGWLPSEKVRLFYGKDQIWFEGPVHELVEPVLRRNGIEITRCGIPVHHYGRLDKEKLDRKGEIYFDIGQRKLSAMGNDLNALRELAVQATILEKNQEAFELWQRLLALNPNPNLAAIAYVNIGTIYSRLGKFEDALDAGKKAFEYDPDLKEARYNYAMAELHCGNAPKTIQVLEDLLKRFPDYPPARFILSAAYCCANQKQKGLAGIIKLQDTPMGVHLDTPCLELAQSLILAEKMEYALMVLGVAIESDFVNSQLLALFKECLKKKETAQKCYHILQPPLANFQEAILENLPQQHLSIKS